MEVQLPIDIDKFQRDGFLIPGSLFSRTQVDSLILHLQQQCRDQDGQRRGGQRDVLDNLPALRALADHPSIRDIVQPLLGIDAFVVRATLFDKTPVANWKVPWHQDVTIAVKARRDTPGYGPWSVKAGVPHVQPPCHVLERMLTIRLHLDPCPATNGALKVMPGSHRLGRLNQNDVTSYVDEKLAVCCAANAGDILVMRPLLLHSSSASLEPAHRRVLHFDFAIGDLANGLQWRMRDYNRMSLFHEPPEQ